MKLRSQSTLVVLFLTLGLFAWGAVAWSTSGTEAFIGGESAAAGTTFVYDNVIYDHDNHTISADVLFRDTDGITGLAGTDLEIVTIDDTTAVITNTSLNDSGTFNSTTNEVTWTVTNQALPSGESWAGFGVKGSYSHPPSPTDLNPIALGVDRELGAYK